MVGINEVSGLLTSSVFPNPFTQTACISLESSGSEKHSLIITDIAGAVVADGSFYGNKVEINRGSLAAGIYQYNISVTSNSISRGKFIIY